MSKLKALGSGTGYVYDRPNREMLERFAAPSSISAANPRGTHQSITIRAPEFTSLCPITGQPDFATIVIDYVPDQWCVESKSLKLYLGAYRMEGEFHEACVNKICNDLVAVLDPSALTVRGEFTPRGGIPFWPTSRYLKK